MSETSYVLFRKFQHVSVLLSFLHIPMIRFTRFLEQGEYNVVVEGFSRSAGLYQLRVDAVPESNTGVYQGDVACSAELTGELNSAGQGSPTNSSSYVPLGCSPGLLC